MLTDGSYTQQRSLPLSGEAWGGGWDAEMGGASTAGSMGGTFQSQCKGLNPSHLGEERLGCYPHSHYSERKQVKKKTGTVD